MLSRVVLESEGQMVILKAFNLMACPLKGNKPSQKQNKHKFSPQNLMLLADLFPFGAPYLFSIHSPKEVCTFREAQAHISEWLP